MGKFLVRRLQTLALFRERSTLQKGRKHGRVLALPRVFRSSHKMDNVTSVRILTGVIFLLTFLPLYFLPAFLARKKRQFVPILLLNIFLGWTFIGWLASLIWAVSAEQPAQVIVQQPILQTAGSSFCSTCGKYSPSGGGFCAACGAAFITPALS